MTILNLDRDGKESWELRGYWKSLGRFIHKFAQLEQQIAFCLALYAQTPKGTAQAVFSGTRARDALSLIDRIREARELPEDPDWTRAKAQFGVINSVRNDIVHLGATRSDEGFAISNANRTLPSLAKVTPISADELDAMTADVKTISETIYAHQLIADGTNPESDLVNFSRIRGRVPWQYKPPQPIHRQDRRRAKKDKHGGPPGS